MEDVAPTGVRQAFSELPLPSHVLPEPGFPDTDPSQVGAWAGGLWAVAWHPCHTRHTRLGLRPHGSWAELPAVRPGAQRECPSQVYSPGLPPAPAQPSSIPPCALVSQPTVQFILQGSLPLVGCGTAQTLAPVPTALTPASEPASQATAASNSEEKTPAPRLAAEKTKKEEVSPASSHFPRVPVLF